MYSIIVQRLKQRMQDLGINARTLTAKSKVGQSFVYDILSGKSKNPTSSKLQVIAKELGVSLSYLVGEDTNNFDNKDYTFGYSLLDGNQAPRLCLSKNYFSRVKGHDDVYTYCMLDDAMAPIFLKHDVLLVGLSNGEKISKGIFAIKYKKNIMIRALENIDRSNKVKIIAANDCFESYEEEITQISVIGRVQYVIRDV